VLDCYSNRYEIHPRFYRHLARGRYTSTQLHEVMRVNENPSIRETIKSLYDKYLEMIARYKMFLQDISINLHQRGSKLVK